MMRSSTLTLRRALEAPGLSEEQLALHRRAVSAARASGKCVWLLADLRLHSRDFWLRLVELLDGMGYPCSAHEAADDSAAAAALLRLREALRLEPRRWGLVVMGTAAPGTQPDAEAAAAAGVRVLYLDAPAPASAFSQLRAASSFGHGGAAAVVEAVLARVEAVGRALCAPDDEDRPLPAAAVLVVGGAQEEALGEELRSALTERGIAAAVTVVASCSELRSALDEHAWLLVVAPSERALSAEDRDHVRARAQRWQRHLEARPRERHSTTPREAAAQMAAHLAQGPMGVSCVFTDGGPAPPGAGAWSAEPARAAAAALPGLDTRAMGRSAAPRVLLLGEDEALRPELARFADVLCASDELPEETPHFLVYADGAALQRHAEVAARFPGVPAFTVADAEAPGVVSVGRYPQGNAATVMGLAARRVVWQQPPGQRAERCGFVYEGAAEEARPLGSALARAMRPVARRLCEVAGKAEGPAVYLLRSGATSKLAAALQKHAVEARAGGRPPPVAVCSSFLSLTQLGELRSAAPGCILSAPLASDVAARLAAQMRLFLLLGPETRVTLDEDLE